MARLVGPVLAVALAVASLLSVAQADVLHDVMHGFAQQSDLRAAYDRATFGTVPVELQVNQPSAPRSYLYGLAFVGASPAARLTAMATSVVFAPLPQVTLDYDRVFTLDDAIDRYDPVISSAIASTPIPSTTFPQLSSSIDTLAPVSLSTVAIVPPSSFGFSDAPTQLAFDARLQDAAIAVPAPIRVGAFQLAGEATTSDYTTLAAHDAQLTAGTIIDVRAGNHRLDLSLGSNYERLTDANAVTFSQATPSDLTRYETTSALAQLPGGSPQMLIPNYADVTARGINAGLAVPVTGRLTVGVGYGTQRLTGSYGTSFVNNLDASNYSYLGNITFSLPRSSSAITLSARQNRYQDNLTPFSLQQTRADLNFTVKF
jgi:hypothetical protein